MLGWQQTQSLNESINYNFDLLKGGPQSFVDTFLISYCLTLDPATFPESNRTLFSSENSLFIQLWMYSKINKLVLLS